MSSIDRLDVLRERNKDLLIQLKQQREKLQRLGGCCSPSRKREREAEEVWTLTGGDRGPARAALTTSTGRFEGKIKVFTSRAKAQDTPVHKTSVSLCPSSLFELH